jgi:predicted amidophosphoribosyltransferase
MRPIRRDWLRRVHQGIARYLLPTPCFGCGRALAVEQFLGACPRCWASIPPAPRQLAAARGGSRIRVYAVVVYRGFARRALLRAKMHGRRELMEPIAGQFSSAVANWPEVPADAVVVPVPSHPWNRLRRGFDPACVLARAAAERTERSVEPLLLARRWRSRPSLKRLGAAERRRAADGSFYCRRPAAVAGRRVLLVDDVWTTGASATACARALLGAGAASVHVAVWASTPRGGGGEARGRPV